jgi:ABC-type antimicrobial peptide transport system permease subunit
MNANLFFTSINVYQNQEGMLKPNLTTLPEVIINKESVSISGSFEYSYKNFDSKEALNEEYMMLGSYGCIHSFSKLTFFNTNIYIESNNYSNLTSSFNKTERYMDTILKTKALFPLKKSDMFQKYQFVYDIITSASLVFLIVACIIMFSAIINIYVTIKHSIKQRAFFLTMLRAIGAKDSTLPKLYMMESSIIVTRANILFVAIGFIITSVIKILIDNALTINNVSYNLSISWLSIIICMLVIIAFLYSVAFIFSFMGIYKLSKKPIMSILNEH